MEFKYNKMSCIQPQITNNKYYIQEFCMCMGQQMEFKYNKINCIQPHLNYKQYQKLHSRILRVYMCMCRRQDSSNRTIEPDRQIQHCGFKRLLLPSEVAKLETTLILPALSTGCFQNMPDSCPSINPKSCGPQELAFPVWKVQATLTVKLLAFEHFTTGDHPKEQHISNQPLNDSIPQSGMSNIFEKVCGKLLRKMNSSGLAAAIICMFFWQLMILRYEGYLGQR